MKYLIWRQKLKELVVSKGLDLGAFEGFCDWKEYFINHLSPEKALDQSGFGAQ